jgi:hypothetical protein
MFFCIGHSSEPSKHWTNVNVCDQINMEIWHMQKNQIATCNLENQIKMMFRFKCLL